MDTHILEQRPNPTSPSLGSIRNAISFPWPPLPPRPQRKVSLFCTKFPQLPCSCGHAQPPLLGLPGVCTVYLILWKAPLFWECLPESHSTGNLWMSTQSSTIHGPFSAHCFPKSHIYLDAHILCTFLGRRRHLVSTYGSVARWKSVTFKYSPLLFTNLGIPLHEV